MDKTVFEITKMDCPSEENLIRMKLSDIESIQNLDFDLGNRKLTVYHVGQLNEIETAIHQLNLNSKLMETGQTDQMVSSESSNQRRLLWTVLLINFGFFVIEITTGFVSRSMGLVADSLDMLADSIVYGLSLFVVGGTIALKKRIAKASGYFQIFLAVLGFIEVIRRFLGMETLPDFETMIIVSALALVGNSICLYLLQRSRSQEAHMKASMIFTSNDVIINIGVITAGVLVHLLDSNKPDLIIGAIVFVLVIQGAYRILKLGK
ncbi:MAG: cation transporter [Chloroflexi bacterium]|nr:cation transporter [Chloroflexota bacterium]